MGDANAAAAGDPGVQEYKPRCGAVVFFLASLVGVLTFSILNVVCLIYAIVILVRSRGRLGTLELAISICGLAAAFVLRAFVLNP